MKPKDQKKGTWIPGMFKSGDRISLLCQWKHCLLGDLKSNLLFLINDIYVCTMQLFNFTYIIGEPSRVTEHRSTLIDPVILLILWIVFIPVSLRIPRNVSEHYLSFWKVLFQWCEIWLYYKIDSDKFCFEDVDDMCKKVTKHFFNNARECTPTKLITLRWFTKEERKEYECKTYYER